MAKTSLHIHTRLSRAYLALAIGLLVIYTTSFVVIVVVDAVCNVYTAYTYAHMFRNCVASTKSNQIVRQFLATSFGELMLILYFWKYESMASLMIQLRSNL